MDDDAKYIVGLDLGQQNDYTVLCVLDVGFNSNTRLTYDLVMLKSFALRTSYIDVVDETIAILNSYDIIDNTTLVIDYTGVGHPVFDYFRIRGLRPLGVSITGGMAVNVRDDSTVTVPKKDIVTYLQLVVQTKRLRIPSNLKQLEDMRKEFMNFKFKISPSMTTGFAGSGGFHDDIVMSLGVAVWTGEFHSRKQLRAVTGK